jgi:hypothetical protein
MTIVSKYAVPEYQNSLQMHVVSSSIISEIINYLNTIPNINSLRMDIEITLHAMKLIEVYCKNDPNNVKCDKKQVLLDAFKIVFPNCLTEDEIRIIINHIDFIYNSDLITICKIEKTLCQYVFTPLRSIYKKLFRKN